MSHRVGTQGPLQLQPADRLAPGDDLIAAFGRTGAPADFERVVQRYAPLVYAECRRVTRDNHDAEDAAQLTFLALAIELRAGAALRKPAAWLQRVAQRQALKLVRSRGRRRKREDAARRTEHAPVEPLKLEIAEREQHAGAIRDAIDALPERYRLPLVLHYFGGLSLEGIATELGIKRQAVGTRLFRARKMLGDALGKRGITMSDARLATIVAALVPAAVVANLLKSGAPVIAQSVPGATFAHGIATLVGIAAGSGARRPAVAAAVLIATAAATSFAWVAPNEWRDAVRATLDVRAWTRWITNVRVPRPTLVPSVTPTPIAATEVPAAPTFALMPPTPADARPIVTAASVASSISTTDAPLSPAIADALRGGPFEPTVDLAAPPAALARIDVGLPSPRATTSGGPTHEGARSSTTIDRDVKQSSTTSFGALIVGDVGTGTYDVAGGRLKVDGLTLGAGVGSSGTLHLGDGTLEVGSPQTPVVVGGRGVGRLYLGTADAPGEIVASPGADAQLIVRATAHANGLIRGWGTVDAGGTLVNNGRIIADGFEHVRSLDLGHFETVANTIDNPRDGTNGWYARRGGRVVLPSLQFDSAHHTATWGESAGDATLDLVNSVRVTLPTQSRPATMNLSLRTVALNDPLDVPLPMNVSIIGLYEVESDGLDGDATFTLRYDHVAADAMLVGELGVRLMAHVEGSWVEANDPILNLYRRTVTGTFDGRLDTLAVTVGSPFGRLGTTVWSYLIDRLESDPAGQRMAYVTGASLPNVPEPATTLGVTLAAIVLLRRRRPG